MSSAKTCSHPERQKKIFSLKMAFVAMAPELACKPQRTRFSPRDLQMLYLCRPSVCCLIIPLSKHQSQLYVVFQVCQSAGILTVGHTNGEVRVYQFDLSSNQISTAVLNESSVSGDLSR